MRPVFIFAVLLALPLLSCKTRQNGSSEVAESSAGQFKSQIALFRKIIGRAPSTDELKAMKGLTYEQQVEYVLNSQAFKNEGFFNLHNDRLLLNRQGDDSWIQGSDFDFCSMRWEFQESAQQDLTGDGYWDLLRHRKRWHAITASSFNMQTCFDVTPQTIVDAYKVDNTFANLTAEDPVKVCLTDLMDNLPRRGAFKEFFDASGVFSYEKFVAYLGTFQEFEMQSSLPNTKMGNDYFQSAIQGIDGEKLIGVPGAKVLSSEGSPIPIRRIQDRSTCSFTDGVLDDSSRFEFNPFYVQMELPAKFEGIHSNPYYLNRHTTSENNGELHRGRMMLYSYFCTDISPDAANVTGGAAVKIKDHDEYFSPSDSHAQKAANCYNCHTKVQPMGNFFLQTVDGVPYNNNEFFVSQVGIPSRPLRKGGYNDGVGFFPIQGESKGMDGLANLLSQHPTVKSCIVNSTWSQLVGRDYPLSLKEKQAAVAAFSKTPNRYSDLVRHLMVNNERGHVYFERGESAIAKIKVEDQVDCAQVLEHIDEEAATQKVAGTCTSSCHARPFSDKNGNISAELYFQEKNVSKVKAAALWKKVYCQVKTGMMPPSSLDQEEKTRMSCIMERKVKGLMKSGALPEDPDAFQCETAVPTLNNVPPHG